jgi:hypothetical protein
MGFKESARTAISRLMSFSQYEFDTSAFGPVARDLFESESFRRVARDVCPSTQQLLDPVQVSFIIQLPGMSVPLHLDAPYFKGASRFQLPVWLLAVMKFSGLFEDAFVHQVQVVAYIHKWTPDDHTDDNSGVSGGRRTTHRASEFTYYNDADGTASIVPPRPLGGTAVDGSKVVHAAQTYMPSHTPPLLQKEHRHSLRHVDDDVWHLTTAEVPNRTLTYTTDQLRIATVYRARCFATDRERRYFRKTVLADTDAKASKDAGGDGDVEQLDEQMGEEEETYGLWSLNRVLRILSDDLVRRGVLSDVDVVRGDDHDDDTVGIADTAAARLTFGNLLMRTYIHYPLPRHTWFPWNVCLLSELVPTLQPLMSLMCA